MAANGRIPTSQLAALPTPFSNKRKTEHLTKNAYASLVRMMLRAVADTNTNFSVWSAYRSFNDQVAMLKLNYTKVSRARSLSSDRSYGGSTWAKKAGRPLTASPGYSNHGNGLAVDIHPGAIQTWLKSNASRFGWVNDVPSEPWHWSYLNPGKDRYRGEGLPNVVGMQKKLGIEADGKPGKGFVAAVKTFQKTNGLDVDGKAGPATSKAILGGKGSGTPAPSVPAPQPDTESYTVEDRPTKNRYTGRKRGDEQGTLTEIAIHHWGSDGQDFDAVVSWLQGDGNGNNNSSAHEVIEGGRVAILAPPEDATWSTGQRAGNLRTYALECRPEADEATIRTVAARIKHVREESGKDLPLKPHNSYTDTACPGRYLDLLDTLDKLARGQDVPIASEPATPSAGGDLPTGKDLLVKLDNLPDFPLLRTPGNLCYYGDVSGPKTSVSGKSANSLNPGEIVGSGKTSGAQGLKKWQKQMGLTPDGRFGGKTEAAAGALQKRAGLKVDKKIGPSTFYAAWLVG